MYINYVEVFNSVQTEDTAIEVNDPIDYGFNTQGSTSVEEVDDKIIEEDLKFTESSETDSDDK